MRSTALLSALLLAACDVSTKPDHASGKDWEQAGAQQLFLDKLTDDYVDAEEGDNTDWKFFKLDRRGNLELTVYWDNKDVNSTIVIRDRFAVELARRDRSTQLEKDKIFLQAEPGTHYLEFHTEKGASVYTVEVAFTPFDHAATDEARPEAVPIGGDLLGDPIPDAVPFPDQPRKRRAGKGRRPAPKRAAAPAKKAIRATITRIQAAKGGSVIYLNRGREHGLERDQTGQVISVSGKPLRKGQFRILKVDARSAKAQCKATPGQIADARMVKVWVEE